MARDIDQQLAAFKPKSYTVRLCEGIDKVLPTTPELIFYDSLEAAVQVMAPGSGPAAADRARAIAEEPGPQKVLQVAHLLDRADAGLSIYTGLSSAVKLYRAGEGERAQALKSDSQQAMDAVLKGLGLAWMVQALFQGGVQERVQAFMALDAGKHMASYYAAIEVGLPFADNAAAGAGGMLAGLFARHEAGQMSKLAGVTGADEAEDASEMAHALLGPMEGMVQQSSQYLSAVAQVAADAAPQVVNVADKVASVAATGADALPVWRFLGARLVAEYAVKRAADELGAEAFGADPFDAPVSASVATPPPKGSGGTALAIALLLALSGAGLAAYLLLSARIAENSETNETSDASEADAGSSSGSSSGGSPEEDAAGERRGERDRDGKRGERDRHGGKAGKRGR